MAKRPVIEPPPEVASYNPEDAEMPLESLVFDPDNARTHSKENLDAVERSLREFGQVERLIVQRGTSIVIGGNGRLAVMKRLGWKTAKVTLLTISDIRRKSLSLALNRTSELATWNDKKLGELLASLDNANAAYMTGFTATEIEKIIAMSAGAAEPAKSAEGDLSIISQIPQSEVPRPAPLMVEPAKPQNLESAATNKPEESTTEVVDQCPYCAISCRVEIGTGLCSYGCKYCYTRMSRIGITAAGRKPKSETVVRHMMKDVSESTRIATIGKMIDPTMPEFEERFMQVLKLARELGVYICVQTKHPDRLLERITKAGFPGNQICGKVSFSVMTDDASKIIEPNAPSCTERLNGMLRLMDYGASSILRLQPLVVGDYRGVEEGMSRLRGGVKRLMVEPMRFYRAAIPYMDEMLPAMEFKTWDEYIERWGYKEEDGRWATFGGNNSFDYDAGKLSREYIALRELANAYGMNFGICSAALGYQYSMLNQGSFCCSVPEMTSFGVKPIESSLAYRTANGTIGDIVIPSLLHLEGGSAAWELEHNRIGWANDARYPILDLPRKDSVP